MLFEDAETHQLRLVSSFRHGLPFLSAELLPVAAWPAETSARPGCSLCQCSVYPARRNKQHTKSPQLGKYSAINPAITVHLCGKHTVQWIHTSTLQIWNPYLYKHKRLPKQHRCGTVQKASWRESKPTLYSKHDTQIVRSSSSLLSCEGGMSVVQRWIRLLSAFFITHKKHTSRFRLVSAGRVAMVLPCWEKSRGTREDWMWFSMEQTEITSTHTQTHIKQPARREIISVALPHVSQQKCAAKYLPAKQFFHYSLTHLDHWLSPAIATNMQWWKKKSF